MSCRAAGAKAKRSLASFALLLVSACACEDDGAPEPPAGMVHIPAGDETDALFMDRHEVTNADFARFVEATGHVTEAERSGWAQVFAEGRWHRVDGADWRHPEGPRSTLADRMDHPVVHVSWEDAQAYARWADKRLPTEAEWVWAARGGLEGAEYPWGDELAPEGRHRANTWQGRFPDQDRAEDGFTSTAPVGSFPENGYGLYDVAGNVWEWTADWDLRQGQGVGTERVIRGGSWLCSPSYCAGYRLAERKQAEPSAAQNHLGFRCVREIR